MASRTSQSRKMLFDMLTTERAALLIDDSWRQWIIDEARTWKGTPFQHKGRIKGVGCDCGGLIYQVYVSLLGPFKPFPKDYAPDWALHRENEIYLDFIEPYVVEVPKAKPGGLAMFRIGRNFGHATICTERDTFIHAWGRNQAGTVTESGKSFFTVGDDGKMRDVKYFDVNPTWPS